jgi:hypothetical protein
MDGNSSRLIASLAATPELVLGEPGTLSWLYAYNPNASAVFVQLFDAATPGAVTPGTTAPKLSLGIPASDSVALNASDIAGTVFENGIVACATTTATGGTAPSTALVFNCGVR